MCFLCYFVIVGSNVANADSLFTTTNTAPDLRLVFHTQGDENIAIRDFFVEFARNEGLRVEDATTKMPLKDNRPVFNLALYQGDKAIVKVTNILKANQFFVGLYLPSPSTSFAGIGSRLTTGLKEKWPDTSPYEGP
jgi:hypothetical protein